MISPLVLVGIPVAIIVLAMVFGYVVPGLRRRRLNRAPIAIVSFGREAAAKLPPRPARAEPPPAAPASYAPPQAPEQDQDARDARDTTAMDAIPVEARAHRAREAAEEPRVLKLQVAGDQRHVVRDAPGGSSNLRLERVPDGTLQFLPGKLEVIEGREVGHELRFVRTPGPDGQTVTFGRSEGTQYRHIQLQEHTVSRQHAKMSLDGKTWTLTNLSRTNPVVVNGMAMSDTTPSVVLRDGDRIEMGEVVFRFRSR